MVIINIYCYRNEKHDMYEEKNCKIRESSKVTRERHSKMDCRVVSVKVQENRVSKAKLEKIKRCFLEAK